MAPLRFNQPNPGQFLEGNHYMSLMEYQSVLGAVSELVGDKNDHQMRLLDVESNEAM